MSKLISIHSFRRGTGRTTLTVNLAVLLAQAGYRVGVIDLNFGAPSSYILFGLDAAELSYVVNDYLWGDCEIEACVVDLSVQMGVIGSLFLVASSPRPLAIARILRGGYYLNLLSDACDELLQGWSLDMLIADTTAGLNEATQLITAVSDINIIVARPDKQDFQGTGILLALTNQLAVPQRWLLVNQVPTQFDPTAVQDQFAAAYQPDYLTLIPHSQTLMALGSSGVFVLEYPEDKITAIFRQIAFELETT